MNFALADWIPKGMACSELYRRYHKTAVFAMEQVVLGTIHKVCPVLCSLQHAGSTVSPPYAPGHAHINSQGGQGAAAADHCGGESTPSSTAGRDCAGLEGVPCPHSVLDPEQI